MRHPLLFTLCAVGFVLSLTIYALTFAGYAVSEHVPGTWVLHVGAMLAGIPVAWEGHRIRYSDERWAYFEQIPAWTIIAGAICVPLIAGSILEAMTREVQGELLDDRIFSGMALLFYASTLVWCLYPPKSARG